MLRTFFQSDEDLSKYDWQSNPLHSGDWDLMISPKYILDDEVDSEGKREVTFEAVVGRDGDLILLDPTVNRLSVESKSLKIVGRHNLWQEKRQMIEEYVILDGGEAYAPINHPDMNHLPVWNDNQRAQLILSHLLKDSSSLLDIGSHTGYMCDFFEQKGLSCTALEVDPTLCTITKIIKRANRRAFTLVEEDLNIFLPAAPNYDVVLALAVFHHFLKTKEGAERFLHLLPNLKCKQLFYWAHNTQEQQMSSAYMNLSTEKICNLILKNTQLTRVELLANVNFRDLLVFSL